MFRIDTALVVQDSFYFGPSCDFTAEQWRSLREPLPVEGIPRVGAWVLASSAAAHIDAIARYARAVKAASTRHGIALARSAYTWARPRITANDQTICVFIGTLDLAAAKAILDGLSSDAPEMFVSDLDEHWEIEIVRDGCDFWFGERDPDSDEPARTCLVDAATVAREAVAAARGLDDLLARLRAEDADLWSGSNAC